MEKTLSLFYNTLKWVENSTADLEFQAQENEKQLG